jgi:hypothetical protein
MEVTFNRYDIVGCSMSYSSEWLIPDRVILFTLGESYTLEDAGLLNQQLLEILNGAKQPVHMMVDLNVMRHYPKRITEEVWSITQCLRHQKLGWLMVVNNNANPMAHLIASVVGKTTGVKMRFEKSQSDAIESLTRVDLSLQAA